jgi:putative transposase
VSESGYHEQLARRRDILRRRHLSDEALLGHIRAVYAENRGAYGWPRIWRQLRAQGIRVASSGCNNWSWLPEYFQSYFRILV